MKKIAIFAFNGDPLCFVHVLLNALDLSARGMSIGIVLEGTSVKLIPELVKPDHQLHPLWKKVVDANLVAGVCRACAVKLGTLEDAVAQDLPLLADMSGHAGIAGFMADGFEILTF
ncbi:DsrE family protein [Myxococcota bacterium]|nr:DsrE family protein [Myxococcota bacterium]MBU1509568.1 DsrE family protein [Myxococcota bacterium]